MVHRRICILLFLVSLSIKCQAQNTDQIKEATPYQKKCKRYITVKKKISAATSYYVNESKGNLFFYSNNEEAFRQLFHKGQNGIYVDIIRRNLFTCDGLQSDHKRNMPIGDVWKPEFGIRSEEA